MVRHAPTTHKSPGEHMLRHAPITHKSPGEQMLLPLNTQRFYTREFRFHKNTEFAACCTHFSRVFPKENKNNRAAVFNNI